MKSKRRHEGYLLIDHRAGPGLSQTEAVEAKAIPVRAGTVFESATITCSHCCRVVVLNPDRSRERAYCPSCDHYICDTCEGARLFHGCRTFSKFADIVSERAVKATQSSLIL